MVICVFGDSITWGAFDFKCGGWANRLRNFWEKKDEGIEVYSLGIAGNTSLDLLKRFENEIKSRRPDVIVVAIGINDVDRKLADFKKSIIILNRISKKYTKKVIFIGLTRVDETKIRLVSYLSGKKYKNDKIEKLDQIIKKICIKNNNKYIELKDKLNGNDLVDGLHPKTSGHEKMFEIINKELQKYLKDEK